MAGMFLVRDLEGNLAFEIAKLRACLESVPGVHGWSKRRPLFCEYTFNADSTIVNLLNDRCIAIEGIGDASLQIALEIQGRYGGDIRAVDRELSFNIPLSTTSSLGDFKDKIARGLGHKDLERRE